MARGACACLIGFEYSNQSLESLQRKGQILCEIVKPEFFGRYYNL
jgi:hypothetical protein